MLRVPSNTSSDSDGRGSNSSGPTASQNGRRPDGFSQPYKAVPAPAVGESHLGMADNSAGPVFRLKNDHHNNWTWDRVEQTPTTSSDWHRGRQGSDMSAEDIYTLESNTKHRYNRTLPGPARLDHHYPYQSHGDTVDEASMVFANDTDIYEGEFLTDRDMNDMVWEESYPTPAMLKADDPSIPPSPSPKLLQNNRDVIEPEQEVWNAPHKRNLEKHSTPREPRSPPASRQDNHQHNHWNHDDDDDNSDMYSTLDEVFDDPDVPSRPAPSQRRRSEGFTREPHPRTPTQPARGHVPRTPPEKDRIVSPTPSQKSRDPRSPMFPWPSREPDLPVSPGLDRRVPHTPFSDPGGRYSPRPERGDRGPAGRPGGRQDVVEDGYLRPRQTTTTRKMFAQREERCPVISFIGGPGAGKTTLAQLLTSCGLAHVSPAALLHEAVSRGNAAGRRLRADLTRGGVAHDVMFSLLKEVIGQTTTSDYSATVLDGFPRTMQQLHRFEDQVGSVDCVIYLQVAPRTMQARRRHQRALEGRADDDEETVARRMENFHSLTCSLIDLYSKRRQLIEVNAEDNIDEVRQRLQNILHQQGYIRRPNS